MEKLLIALTIGLLICGNGNTAIAAKYEIIDLGTLGKGSEAWAVNNSGNVVGTSFVNNGLGTYYARAFYYDGKMHNLGTIGGAFSNANDINDFNQVVGTSNNLAGDSRAFLYDGTMKELGTLGGNYSRASAINNSGFIVGNSSTTNNGNSRAFLYDGTMHNLGTFGRNNNTYASEINDAGVIIGSSLSSPDIIYYGGMYFDLGPFVCDYSSVYAINNNGMLAGAMATDLGFFHAFSFDGIIHDLGTLGGDFSYAFAINDSGATVGKSGTNNIGDYHAFLYDGGTMHDLNDLIFEGSDWLLYEARDINNLGQIVGTGMINGENRAFLLNPVPIPGANWLLGSGLAGLVGLRRKFKK